MAQVESQAPVIDFEVLLTPIPGENPSGEPMQYSGLYDDIREARRADDDVNLGEWKSELKVSDFRKVINLAVPALSTKTKDLQVCAWLCEALTNQHGFIGLRDGIRLMRQIQENFWDTFYPEIDEGDMEGRANAVEWMNNQMSLAVKKIPFTAGEGFNYINWFESTQFDFPAEMTGLEYAEQERIKALKIQAETEKRKTGDMWRVAKAATNRAFCEQVNKALEECWEELNQLDKVNEEKYDRNQTPGLKDIKKSLEEIRQVFGKVLDEKREAEPDAIEEEVVEETVESEDGETVVVKKGMAVGSGVIQSRGDALKRLSELADYFRKTEPHSPISYIIQRAVKWGNMPLEIWLQDVIKDDNIIAAIRQTLGFNTGGDEPPQ
ncbi:MAG: type VI secretion system protein TssA [Pyrinomonadaceae bacterium]|nr:type VI secretion system protein TssA [Pyrinomonadaceae bacterium]